MLGKGQVVKVLTPVFRSRSSMVWTSVANPERFDADVDSDPTFQADADPDPDPDPNPFTRVRNLFSSNFQLLFPKSSKTWHV